MQDLRTTLEHRRQMAIKGSHHIQTLAVTAAGAAYEPLPRRKRGKKQAR